MSFYVHICLYVLLFLRTTRGIPTALTSRSTNQTLQTACTKSTFNTPELFGAEILDISATAILNYSLSSANITNLDFCQVNVTYTHPGRNDSVQVQAWLPLSGWNTRFLGIGGGGFSMATYDPSLAPAVIAGYAAATTNGGVDTNTLTPEKWALTSPGDVNYGLLLNFASQCLNDLPIIGKSITQSFYNSSASHSYWSGCSTGGRQGLMSAQRYPTNYDGILAEAPATYWTRFIPALHWAQVAMFEEDSYPPLCEFEAITAAAVKSCDLIDGVQDGIIAAPGLCHFDPHSLVGQSFNCSGRDDNILVASSHCGREDLARSNNFRRFLNLFSNGTGASNPFLIGATWISYFLAKDPLLDTASITYDEYASFSHQSVQEYNSIIGTDDADLSAFKATGGKMLTWHGVADQLIPTNNSIHYYESVRALDPEIEDFYRLFLAPGVGHCAGGVGFMPDDALGALVQWVENGIEPVTLSATSLTTGRKQPLCKYPLVALWDGIHDTALETSYECGASFAL